MIPDKLRMLRDLNRFETSFMTIVQSQAPWQIGLQVGRISSVQSPLIVSSTAKTERMVRPLIMESPKTLNEVD